jgi:hypothetical protein
LALADKQAVVLLHYKFKHLYTVGTATNWSKISSGTDHNLAIKPMVVYGFTSNGSGQLGNNSTTRAFAPVQIGTDINWDSIHGGSGYQQQQNRWYFFLLGIQCFQSIW